MPSSVCEFVYAAHATYYYRRRLFHNSKMLCVSCVCSDAMKSVYSKRMRCGVLDRRRPTGNRTNNNAGSSNNAWPSKSGSGRQTTNITKHITHIVEHRSKSHTARCVWNWNGRNITTICSTRQGKARQASISNYNFLYILGAVYNTAPVFIIITQYSVVCEGMFFCFLMFCIIRAHTHAHTLCALHICACTLVCLIYNFLFGLGPHNRFYLMWMCDRSTVVPLRGRAVRSPARELVKNELGREGGQQH